MTTTSETASNSIQDMLFTLSRNWWLFGLRGVLALMIAGLAFLMPAESLLALTLVFGAFSFADGVFGLVAGGVAAQQNGYNSRCAVGRLVAHSLQSTAHFLGIVG